MTVSLILTLVLLCLVTRVSKSQNTSTSAPVATPVAGGTTSEPATGSGGGWGGCVDPTAGFRPVTIGESTTVCLVLSNHPDWATSMSYMRLNFQPIADEYSRFHVPQSYQQLVVAEGNALSNTFPGNITVHVESQTA
jgi:hypothetical protein